MNGIDKLLLEYGYPQNRIPYLKKEITSMNYEEVEKSILPYHDITADHHDKSYHYNEYEF